MLQSLQPAAATALPLEGTASSWTRCFKDRACRVWMLLAGVAAISVADLIMTLTYATSVGMIEMNPIAHAIMSTGSVWLVVLWKFATAGLGIMILCRFRRQAAAEIASWLCFVGMVMLLIHWMSFNTQIVGYAEELASLADSGAPRWVQMPAVELY